MLDQVPNWFKNCKESSLCFHSQRERQLRATSPHQTSLLVKVKSSLDYILSIKRISEKRNFISTEPRVCPYYKQIPFWKWCSVVIAVTSIVEHGIKKKRLWRDSMCFAAYCSFLSCGVESTLLTCSWSSADETPGYLSPSGSASPCQNTLWHWEQRGSLPKPEY